MVNIIYIRKNVSFKEIIIKSRDKIIFWIGCVGKYLKTNPKNM